MLLDTFQSFYRIIPQEINNMALSQSKHLSSFVIFKTSSSSHEYSAGHNHGAEVKHASGNCKSSSLLPRGYMLLGKQLQQFGDLYRTHALSGLIRKMIYLKGMRFPNTFDLTFRDHTRNEMLLHIVNTRYRRISFHIIVKPQQ